MPDRTARTVAADLVAAVATGDRRTREAILARDDLRQIAVECARWAAVLGRASFSSKQAFLTELQRAASVLDSQAEAAPLPSG